MEALDAIEALESIRHKLEEMKAEMTGSNPPSTARPPNGDDFNELAKEVREALAYADGEEYEGDTAFTKGKYEPLVDISEEGQEVTIFRDPYYVCTVKNESAGGFNGGVIEVHDANALIRCEGNEIRARELRDGELENTGS